MSRVGVPVSFLKWVYAHLMLERLTSGFYLFKTGQQIRDFYEPHCLKYLTIEINDTTRRLPIVIEFDNTLHGFPPHEIRTCFSDTTFKLDRSLRAKTRRLFRSYRWMLRVHRQKYVDGELARLKCVSSDKKGVKLCLQPVKYNVVCKTHMCLDAPIGMKGETIRHLVHSHGLEDLQESRLANSLGVNTLLFTVDGKLIIQERSRRVVAFPSMLGVPSSGAFEADDFRYAGEGHRSFPFLREAKEELYIHHEDIETADFLGITRELFRGGKPEMFFVAQTKLAQSRIKRRRKKAKDKWESSGLIFWEFGEHIFNKELSADEKFDFRRRMDALFQKHDIESMSWPLSSALALWQKDVLGR